LTEGRRVSATRYAFCRMIETEAPAVLADPAANFLPLYTQRLAKPACRILNAADAADQTWLRQRQEEPDLYPDALERMKRLVETKHRIRWQDQDPKVTIYDTVFQLWPPRLRRAVVKWARRYYLLMDGNIPKWFMDDIEFTLYMWQRLGRQDRFWCADIDLPKGPH